MSFVKKAGTTILAMAVVVWVLSYFPNGELQISFLVRFGHFVEPVGRLMGFDWRLKVALLTSFPAKEKAIAMLGVLFGSNPTGGLSQVLTASFSTASALSFLVVTMRFIPCMATVAAVRQETGSWRWDTVQCGHAAGDFDRCRKRNLSYRSFRRVIAMLEQLINEIQAGGTLETYALAARQGASLQMIQAMLEHLQRARLIRPYSSC